MKSLLYCFVMILLIGNISYGQKTSDEYSKKEQKYHNKQNSKFVNQVKTIQEKIKIIRADKSLSEDEKKEKITPLFNEMKSLREANIANRQWEGDQKDMKRNQKEMETVVAQNDPPKTKTKTKTKSKTKSKSKAKNSPKSDRKRIKRLQKEINRIRKDSSLSEAEKRIKLEPIHEELLSIKSGKKMGEERVAGRNGRVLKTDTAKQDGEMSAREKWKADRIAKREAKMDKELSARKKQRQKAREKRDKKIEQWKIKAREEKKNMKSEDASIPSPSATKTTKVATNKVKTDKPMSSPSNVTNPDPLDMSNDPVFTKSEKKKVNSSRMLKRLEAMSDRLTSLNASGLIKQSHFEKKMAHIRTLRERFLKP